ncbi:MAG TPA: histidinol-phosphate transaminase [Thermodesulfobacteriota bacterium]|nr:histidinol-phosphate transaminase [Thermodesulfobacteriota bacterium]
MKIRCSFCDISLEEAKGLVEKGDASICNECIMLVKEIINEFSMSEPLERIVVCSFCGKEQGGTRVVFQGQCARICNECVSEIEQEIGEAKQGRKKTLPQKLAKKQKKSVLIQDDDLIKSRVKWGIQELAAYSVPHHECPVKLDGNESPFSLPHEVLEKVLKELSEISINRYPDPEARSLREKISKIEHFPLEGIILGNGSDELIGMLMTTFSGGTGRVLYPVPTFSMLRIMGTTLGLELVEVELDEHFDIDIEKTIDEIERKNPDLIFLASPNNPTGNGFSEDRIFKILNHAKGVVVVDEAYCDFAGRTFLPQTKRYENLIILRTMSKVGFAGIRLGLLFGRSNLVREINKVRLPYNLNSLSQRVAEIVLESPEFVRENVHLIVKERGRVYNALKHMEKVQAFPSDANFVLFRVEDADRIFKELVDRGVLIRNFNSPGKLKDCMRVTIGTPEENEAFLKALGEILSS